MAQTKQPDWRGFLARPPLAPSSAKIAGALRSAPILITGAGGSIGSALALRLTHLPARCLILIEMNERNLFELRQAWSGAPQIFLLGNAGDRALLEEIFSAHNPRLVFHAAAYKHVPLLERNPLAAIENNIFTTAAVAAVAAEYDARVVQLSTDKAVAPTSVMGATKRVAEEMVLSASGVVLRLGNVLASSGSVAEIFARQIANGGPLTVTDPEARRFFLTTGEAVSLLLTAAAYPDSPSLLAPHLTAEYGIADLARFMARELAPSREIPLHFTGPRPGDKLSERLWDDGESAGPSLCEGLLEIRSARPEPLRFKNGLASLQAALNDRDLSAVLDQLQQLAPGYHPSQTVLNLAQEESKRVCL